jgi:hypothetical protein
MISLRRRAPKRQTVVEPRLFLEAMRRPAIARDLFLPLEQAWWDGDRLTLGKWKSAATRPSVRGVRLQEPRPDSASSPPERDTQGDLTTLVGSVSELRRIPEFAGMVLSDETLIGEQNSAVPGKRVLFGLACPADCSFQGETPAAAECHRVLRRSIQRAGFSVEHPREPFNPTSGLDGLRAWTGAVRLRRKPSRRPWLLLLLLPLLFLPLECLRQARNNRPAVDLTASADDSKKNNGSDKGAGADGSNLSAANGGSGKGNEGKGGGNGKGNQGNGGGGNGKGKDGTGGGGNGGGGGPNQPNAKPNPPAQPPPAPATRPPANVEEAGPRTTIPSKMPKPGSVVTSPGPRATSTRRYGAD